MFFYLMIIFGWHKTVFDVIQWIIFAIYEYNFNLDYISFCIYNGVLLVVFRLMKAMAAIEDTEKKENKINNVISEAFKLIISIYLLNYCSMYRNLLKYY